MILVASDNPKLIVTCSDGSAPIDLTGATVKLRWKIDSAAVVEKSMTVTNPTGGVAEYVFVTADLTTGTMSYEVQITTNVGSILTQTTLGSITIRSRL